MIVVGAGTGGTVAGIGRKIKEKLPHVKVLMNKYVRNCAVSVNHCL